MKIINTGRQTGKTVYLINESYKNGYPIVVKNYEQKRNIECISKRLNKKVTVFAVDEFLTNPNLFRGIKDKPEAVLIDDLDSMLDKLVEKALHIKVDKATMTIPMNIEPIESK